MRGILKLTQILPSLLIGIIIGGAIKGDRSLLLWGIGLLALDVVVGITLQYFVDKRSRDFDEDDYDDYS